MTHRNKTNKKIVMYGKHIAWLDNEMLEKFNIIINKDSKNIYQWIKEECKNDFSISLDNKEMIDILDSEVKKHLYKDKAEWIRTKIREEIKKHTI